MNIYLVNIFWFCLILLVITFIVAMVQVVLMLIDMRSATKQAKKMVEEIEKKIKAFTSILDIATLVLGGFEGVKARVIRDSLGKNNLVAFFAGFKKGIQVLLGGEKK